MASDVRGQALRRGGGHRDIVNMKRERAVDTGEVQAEGVKHETATRRKRWTPGVVERAASLIASSILQRSRKGGGAEDGEVQAEARAVDIGEVQAEGVKHNAAT